MSIPVTADGLDFQTVFQIVASFEIASVWKGAIAFKRGAFTDIGGGAVPVFNDGAFRTACDDLKSCDHKIRALMRISKMLLAHWFRSVKYKVSRSLSAVFWDVLRWMYKKLVFILQMTPIFTISLLGLSYLLQRGCQGMTFRYASVVVWFIVAKTSCYLLCWIFANLIIHHIRVKVPASDETDIISSK